MYFSKSTGGFYSRDIHGDAIPADSVAITPEHHAELMAGQSSGKLITSDAHGNPVQQDPPPPTVKQIEGQFIAAIQQRLDDFACTRNYDSILSACTYATSTVAKFKTDGQTCVNLRDTTWATAYKILAEVQAGDRPMPSNIADIEAELPAAVWSA